MFPLMDNQGFYIFSDKNEKKFENQFFFGKRNHEKFKKYS